MGKRRQTDPSTVSGQQGGLGGEGGGVLELLEEDTFERYIDSLEFSEPNFTEPEDLEEIYEEMDGEGTEEDPKIITNDYELQAMDEDDSGYYALGNNIDCYGTRSWDGKYDSPTLEDEGGFDGRGYVIKGLDSSNGLIGGIGVGEIEVIEIKRFVMYDCISEANSMVVASTYNNMIEDEDVFFMEDILVHSCSVRDEQNKITSSTSGRAVGAICGILELRGSIKNCGVVNSYIEFTGQDDNGRSAGAVIGEIQAWDWSDDGRQNASISQCYSYNNEIEMSHGDTSYRAGSIIGRMEYPTDDDVLRPRIELDSLTSFGRSPNPPVGGIFLYSDDEFVDNLEVTRVYHANENEEDDIIIVYEDEDNDIFEADALEEWEFISIPEEELRGDSAQEETDLDFIEDWMAVNSETSAIHIDGFPILRQLEEEQQILAQGLKDPRNGEAKGITDDGRLINVGEEDIIQREGYASLLGDGARVGHSHPMSADSDFGLKGELPPVPSPGAGATICEDVEGDRIVAIGGEGQEGVPVRVYDPNEGEWLEDEYPDIGEDLEDMEEEELSWSYSARFTHDVIAVVGGETSEGKTDKTFFLYLGPLNEEDGDDPEWRQEEELPEPMSNIGGVNMGGYSLLFGGEKEDGLSDQIYFFNANRVTVGTSRENRTIISSDFSVSEEFEDLPLGGAKFNGELPRMGNEIYLGGEWDEGDDNKRKFFKYNRVTQAFEELEDLSGLTEEERQSIEETDIGFGDGQLVGYKDNIAYISGDEGARRDVAYYSPERDEWEGRVNPRGFEAEGMPWLGAKMGLERDGVVYFPGTEEDPENFWAYVIESEPFGGN